MPPASDSRSHLLEVLTPVVSALNLDLEDVSVASVGRRSVVRVIVDSDTGVDLDAVADVSRAVSEALDADAGEGFAGPFVLEVSSPGVDRPLTEERHWRRAVGRLVQVPVDGKSVTARIEATDQAGVRLDIKGIHRSVPWSALGPGKVQVEFNRHAGTEITEDDMIDHNPADDAIDDSPDDALEGDE